MDIYSVICLSVGTITVMNFHVSRNEGVSLMPNPLLAYQKGICYIK